MNENERNQLINNIVLQLDRYGLASDLDHFSARLSVSALREIKETVLRETSFVSHFSEE